MARPSTATETPGIVKSPARRARRTTLGVRNRLTVRNKDADYVYRVVNDVEDRVELFKEMGYEIVPTDDVQIGDRRVDVGSNVGSAASVAVGQGIKGIIMRQRKEWYDEDQAAKQADIDRMEQTMGKQDGLYGNVKVGRGRPEDF